ncbi:hypothetical protein GS682_07120 [Nostoc sp. B(2019)]|nr:hypothetical protein [Nostoc sp. B(2019)]
MPRLGCANAGRRRTLREASYRLLAAYRTFRYDGLRLRISDNLVKVRRSRE